MERLVLEVVSRALKILEDRLSEQRIKIRKFSNRTLHMQVGKEWTSLTVYQLLRWIEQEDPVYVEQSQRFSIERFGSFSNRLVELFTLALQETEPILTSPDITALWNDPAAKSLRLRNELNGSQLVGVRIFDLQEDGSVAEQMGELKKKWNAGQPIRVDQVLTTAEIYADSLPEGSSKFNFEQLLDLLRVRFPERVPVTPWVLEGDPVQAERLFEILEPLIRRASRMEDDGKRSQVFQGALRKFKSLDAKTSSPSTGLEEDKEDKEIKQLVELVSRIVPIKSGGDPSGHPGKHRLGQFLKSEEAKSLRVFMGLVKNYRAEQERRKHNLGKVWDPLEKVDTRNTREILTRLEERANRAFSGRGPQSVEDLPLFPRQLIHFSGPSREPSVFYPRVEETELVQFAILHLSRETRKISPESRRQLYDQVAEKIKRKVLWPWVQEMALWYFKDRFPRKTVRAPEEDSRELPDEVVNQAFDDIEAAIRNLPQYQTILKTPQPPVRIPTQLKTSPKPSVPRGQGLPTPKKSRIQIATEWVRASSALLRALIKAAPPGVNLLVGQGTRIGVERNGRPAKKFPAQELIDYWVEKLDTNWHGLLVKKVDKKKGTIELVTASANASGSRSDDPANVKYLPKISQELISLAADTKFLTRLWKPLESAGLEERGTKSDEIKGQRVLLFTRRDDYGMALVKELEGSPHQIVGVVTIPRAKNLSQWARERRISVWDAGFYFDTVFVKQAMRDDPSFRTKMEKLVQELRGVQPDVSITAHFPYLPPPVVGVSARALNVHPSRLPRYAGGFTLPALILNGEKETTVTIHELTDKTDAGDIVKQQGGIPIQEQDNASTLQAKVVPVAAHLLREALDDIGRGSYSATPQGPPEGPHAWGIRTRQVLDGTRTILRNEGLLTQIAIDWNQLHTEEILRRVRAFRRDQSNIYAYTNDERSRPLFLVRAEGIEGSFTGKAGQVLRMDEDGGVVVKTVDGAVKVWFEGGKVVGLKRGSLLNTTIPVSEITGIPQSDPERIDELTAGLEESLEDVEARGRAVVNGTDVLANFLGGAEYRSLEKHFTVSIKQTPRKDKGARVALGTASTLETLKRRKQAYERGAVELETLPLLPKAILVYFGENRLRHTYPEPSKETLRKFLNKAWDRKTNTLSVDWRQKAIEEFLGRMSEDKKKRIFDLYRLLVPKKLENSPEAELVNHALNVIEAMVKKKPLARPVQTESERQPAQERQSQKSPLLPPWHDASVLLLDQLIKAARVVKAQDKAPSSEGVYRFRARNANPFPALPLQPSLPQLKKWVEGGDPGRGVKVLNQGPGFYMLSAGEIPLDDPRAMSELPLALGQVKSFLKSLTEKEENPYTWSDQKEEDTSWLKQALGNTAKSGLEENAGGTPEPLSYAELLERALAAYQRGDFQEAARLFARFLEKNPDDVDVMNNLATAWTGMGNLTDAIRLYERIQQHHPGKSGSIFTNLGAAYLMVGRAEDARRVLEEAVQVNPEDSHAWTNLMVARFAQGMHEGAIAAGLQAVKLDPRNGTNWLGLGSVYTASGRVSEAVNSFREAVRLDPKLLAGWLNLGSSQITGSNPAEAEDSFRRALLLDRDDWRAWGGFVEAHFLEEVRVGQGQSGHAVASGFRSRAEALFKIWRLLWWRWHNPEEGEAPRLFQGDVATSGFSAEDLTFLLAGERIDSDTLHQRIGQGETVLNRFRLLGAIIAVVHESSWLAGGKVPSPGIVLLNLTLLNPERIARSLEEQDLEQTISRVIEILQSTSSVEPGQASGLEEKEGKRSLSRHDLRHQRNQEAVAPWHAISLELLDRLIFYGGEDKTPVPPKVRGGVYRFENRGKWGGLTHTSTLREIRDWVAEDSQRGVSVQMALRSDFKLWPIQLRAEGELSLGTIPLKLENARRFLAQIQNDNPFNWAAGLEEVAEQAQAAWENLTEWNRQARDALERYVQSLSPEDAQQVMENTRMAHLQSKKIRDLALQHGVEALELKPEEVLWILFTSGEDFTAEQRETLDREAEWVLQLLIPSSDDTLDVAYRNDFLRRLRMSGQPKVLGMESVAMHALAAAQDIRVNRTAESAMPEILRIFDRNQQDLIKYGGLLQGASTGFPLVQWTEMVIPHREKAALISLAPGLPKEFLAAVYAHELTELVLADLLPEYLYALGEGTSDASDWIATAVEMLSLARQSAFETIREVRLPYQLRIESSPGLPFYLVEVFEKARNVQTEISSDQRAGAAEAIVRETLERLNASGNVPHSVEKIKPYLMGAALGGLAYSAARAQVSRWGDSDQEIIRIAGMYLLNAAVEGPHQSFQEMIVSAERQILAGLEEDKGTAGSSEQEVMIDGVSFQRGVSELRLLDEEPIGVIDAGAEGELNRAIADEVLLNAVQNDGQPIPYVGFLSGTATLPKLDPQRIFQGIHWMQVRKFPEDFPVAAGQALRALQVVYKKENGGNSVKNLQLWDVNFKSESSQEYSRMLLLQPVAEESGLEEGETKPPTDEQIRGWVKAVKEGSRNNAGLLSEALPWLGLPDIEPIPEGLARPGEVAGPWFERARFLGEAVDSLERRTAVSQRAHQTMRRILEESQRQEVQLGGNQTLAILLIRLTSDLTSLRYSAPLVSQAVVLLGAEEEENIRREELAASISPALQAEQPYSEERTSAVSGLVDRMTHVMSSTTDLGESLSALLKLAGVADSPQWVDLKELFFPEDSAAGPATNPEAGLEEGVGYVAVEGVGLLVPAGLPSERYYVVALGAEQVAALVAAGRNPRRIIAVASGPEEVGALTTLGVPGDQIVRAWNWPTLEVAKNYAIRLGREWLAGLNGLSVSVLEVTANSLQGILAQLRELLPFAWQALRPVDELDAQGVLKYSV